MKDILQLFDLYYYSINPYSFVPLMVACVAILIFYFLFCLDKYSDLNRSLGTVALSCAIWLTGISLMLNASLYRVAFFWSHIMYLGIVLTPVTLFHLSSVIAQRQTRQRIVVIILFGLALLTFLGETYFFQGMQMLSFGPYPLVGSLGGQSFIDRGGGIFYFIVLCYLLSFINFISTLLKSPDPAAKSKIRFFMAAFLAFLLSYSDLLISYVSVNNIIFDALAMTSIVILGFMIGTLFFVFRQEILAAKEHAVKLQSELEKKTLEISNIVGELRATQLKLLETGKVSAVASLSAGILHQISQPITAIHGFVKFIKKEMKPEETFYRPICLMEEQSQYLKEMLEDLMELIRHREIKKESINVNSCINRAMNLLTDELRIRRVNWDLFLDNKLPMVHADSVHLQQVFMNVVINAIQALSTLPRGSNRYLKITSEFNPYKNQVILSFQDTGPGLPPEDQKQVFEPFFSTKTKGAGIGLALCKDLIAEHRGTIEVVSTLGEGANFIIKLPSAAAVDPANLGVQKI